MRIEVEGQEFQIRNISYAAKLGLQGEFADAYSEGFENVKQKEFGFLLGNVGEIAFNKPEETLKEYDHEFQLRVLTACLLKYLGIEDDEKKEDGG